MSTKKGKFLYFAAIILFWLALVYVFSGSILAYVGGFLVVDEKPVRSEAVVVLNTEMEYYPRLIEAADLYRLRLARKIVINGNRKTDALRSFEKKGFRQCCPWYEDRVRMLELMGVPIKDVITVGAEDAYDTVSEAEAVGRELIGAGMKRIIITTSKSHTRRARHIWKNLWSDKLKIRMVAAHSDPYSPGSWWKEGRQIRWVLQEYGAWVYYYWMKSRS
jgi:uncharacterized SAM-binding protein YcdF (DUF218 family)